MITKLPKWILWGGAVLAFSAGCVNTTALMGFANLLGQLAAAMACGLQNAMVATYSGAVIRTTHLTGLTSDMGAAIGNWLAGRSISKPTLGFQAVIWYCFCGGSTVGAFLFAKVGYDALLVPIAIVLTAAFIYNYVSNHLPEQRERKLKKRSSS